MSPLESRRDPARRRRRRHDQRRRRLGHADHLPDAARLRGAAGDGQHVQQPRPGAGRRGGGGGLPPGAWSASEP
nr:hypothetical protein [Nocardioides convexus]